MEMMRCVLYSKKRNDKTREIKFVYNTFSSVLLQLIRVVCGFVLPRLFLEYYGSDTNGMIASITQYLAFINFLDMGVGAVTQSAYYRPIAQRNMPVINAIYSESSSFFKRVGIALVAYIVMMCVVLPRVLICPYSKEYVVLLILVLSTNQLAQFFFAIPDQLLLCASQNNYILNVSQIVLLIISTVLSVALIITGSGIHLVKFASAIVFFVNPVILHFHVLRKFGFRKIKRDDNVYIKQKKNGFAQHCATVIMDNTDVMLLSVLTSVSTVSVYTVYALVTSGIKQIINALFNSFFSLLGDLFARKDEEKLQHVFGIFQWGINAVSVVLFSVTLLLIVPFVQLYTHGVQDADYFQPIFAYIFVLSQFIFCLRIPYNSMICSAGHYKQTQGSAVAEAVINIVISISFVFAFGLTGVAIGTFVAILYRAVSLCRYLHKKILHINYRHIIKQIVIDIIELLMILSVGFFLLNSVLSISGFIDFVLSGIVLFSIALFIVSVVNCIFYNRYLNKVKDSILVILKRRCRKKIS